MPQVLKDEIRENILNCALEEFYTKNFRAARVVSIAQGAGIPLGLIYSYFKNKNDLFEQIIAPVKRQIGYLVPADQMSETAEENLYERELPALLDYIENYNKEIVILIDKSEGSRFESAKEDLINVLAEHLKLTPVFKHTDYDGLFFHILANNFMEGVFEIARHYRGRDWAKNMMDLLIRQHLYGTTSLQAT